MGGERVREREKHLSEGSQPDAMLGEHSGGLLGGVGGAGGG